MWSKTAQATRWTLIVVGALSLVFFAAVWIGMRLRPVETCYVVMSWMMRLCR